MTKLTALMTDLAPLRRELLAIVANTDSDVKQCGRRSRRSSARSNDWFGPAMIVFQNSGLGGSADQGLGDVIEQLAQLESRQLADLIEDVQGFAPR